MYTQKVSSEIEECFFLDVCHQIQRADPEKSGYNAPLVNFGITKDARKAHNIEGINTYSLHPGVIKTELGRHLDKSLFRGARRLFGLAFYLFMKTPESGAQTSIYCAVDEKCANETGLYYSDCVVTNPNSKALKDEYGTKLWEKSVELVKLGDYDPFAVKKSEVTSK